MLELGLKLPQTFGAFNGPPNDVPLLVNERVYIVKKRKHKCTDRNGIGKQIFKNFRRELKFGAALQKDSRMFVDSPWVFQ